VKRAIRCPLFNRATRRALFTALVAGACTSGTDPSNESALSGTWRYDAEQQTPSVAVLEGTVTWSDVSGDGAVEGTFSLVESGASGSQRVLAGTTGGLLLSDSIADFDLIEPSITRRHHLGILRGDSVVGSWASQTGATGAFVLRREGSNP
jgi:hypothetical protein